MKRTKKNPAMGRPKKYLKGFHRIHAVVSEESYKKLQVICKKEGRTITGIVQVGVNAEITRFFGVPA